ncbi:hypothetical protein DPEC_G00379150 [Dallia pectoralis]|nr:hypothetical protein DPEC_G00379150 [Dallia pectoralis]
MNRLQRKLMPMQNTLYLIPTAKMETYPISTSKGRKDEESAQHVFKKQKIKKGL